MLTLMIPVFALLLTLSLFTFLIYFWLKEQLDVALSKTCKHFDVSHYTKVQVAYTLLGKTQVSDLTSLQDNGDDDEASFEIKAMLCLLCVSWRCLSQWGT